VAGGFSFLQQQTTIKESDFRPICVVFYLRLIQRTCVRPTPFGAVQASLLMTVGQKLGFHSPLISPAFAFPFRPHARRLHLTTSV